VSVVTKISENEEFVPRGEESEEKFEECCGEFTLQTAVFEEERRD
jgi:hypothetical protein